jgi:carbon starvation protein
VTLAVGMAHIFDRAVQRISSSGEQAMQSLWKYWYHFAIMFEALFILTTIDAGTRIGRFLIQEIAGKVHPQLGRTDWWPGAIASTVLIVFAWAWFMNSDSFDTIWTMFGIANQMLAVIALTVVSVCLVNEGKGRYVWVTVVPLAVVMSTTSSAAMLMLSALWNSKLTLYIALKGVLILVILSCALVVVLSAVARVLAGARQRVGFAPSLAVRSGDL